MSDTAADIVRLTHELLWSPFFVAIGRPTSAFAPTISRRLNRKQRAFGARFGVSSNYFPDKPSPPKRPGEEPTITISSPHVRIMGDAALIAYIRLVQTKDAAGNHITKATEETRVWQKQSGFGSTSTSIAHRCKPYSIASCPDRLATV